MVLKYLCDQYGAELVWPANVNYHTFNAVIANHREAVEVNDALLAPVGEEWKTYFGTTGNFRIMVPMIFTLPKKERKRQRKSLLKPFFHNL